MSNIFTQLMIDLSLKCALRFGDCGIDFITTTRKDKVVKQRSSFENEKLYDIYMQLFMKDEYDKEGRDKQLYSFIFTCLNEEYQMKIRNHERFMESHQLMDPIELLQLLKEIVSACTEIKLIQNHNTLLQINETSTVNATLNDNEMCNWIGRNQMDYENPIIHIDSMPYVDLEQFGVIHNHGQNENREEDCTIFGLDDSGCALISKNDAKQQLDSNHVDERGNKKITFEKKNAMDIKKYRNQCRKSLFTENEKVSIMQGVSIHGEGNWKRIKNEFPLVFQKRSAVDIKDCYRNMKKHM